MITTGLSAQEQAAFVRGLFSHHSIRVSVDVLDLDHNVISQTTGRLLAGQVDYDTEAQISRSCSLSVLDYDGQLNLDQEGPATAAQYLDRMVRVTYGVRSPQLPRWVDIPVFTGPIDSLARNNDVVSLTAVGKESLLLGKASYNQTFRKGTRTVDVLNGLLDMAGERFRDIPTDPKRLSADIVVGPQTITWDLLQGVARSIGNGSGRLWYDGRGVIRFTPVDNATRVRFHYGDGGGLLSYPSVTYSSSDVRNLVVVQGAEKAALGVATAQGELSPLVLGRNGRPRYLREDIEDSVITTKAAAQKLAETELSRLARLGVQLDFDVVPFPLLEEGDVIDVSVPAWRYAFAPRKWTLPLSSSESMKIGRNHAVARAGRARTVVRKGPQKGVSW